MNTRNYLPSEKLFFQRNEHAVFRCSNFEKKYLKMKFSAYNGHE